MCISHTATTHVLLHPLIFPFFFFPINGRKSNQKKVIEKKKRTGEKIIAKKVVFSVTFFPTIVLYIASVYQHSSEMKCIRSRSRENYLHPLPNSKFWNTPDQIVQIPPHLAGFHSSSQISQPIQVSNVDKTTSPNGAVFWRIGILA